jgi:hypothetical protein
MYCFMSFLTDLGAESLITASDFVSVSLFEFWLDWAAATTVIAVGLNAHKTINSVMNSPRTP